MQCDTSSGGSPACHSSVGQSSNGPAGELPPPLPRTLVQQGAFTVLLLSPLCSVQPCCGSSSAPGARQGDAAALHSACTRVWVCRGAGCLSPATAVQEVLCPEPAQEPGGGRLAPRSHQACSPPANTLVFLKRHPRA